MSNKRFLLLIISIVLFALAFIGLIIAMILHAIGGDSSYAPAIMAMGSFASGFVAVVLICIFGKGEKQ